jgi:hypothetical protein
MSKQNTTYEVKELGNDIFLIKKEYRDKQVPGLLPYSSQCIMLHEDEIPMVIGALKSHKYRRKDG